MTTIAVNPALFLLFNHRLTSVQEADALASLGVGRIVAPPEAIQHLWSATRSCSATSTAHSSTRRKKPLPISHSTSWERARRNLQTF
jgi:2-methylisocitrate lyase-like PEP mutase family enzyme